MTREWHRAYLEGSPFYAALHARYGARMARADAEAHAGSHYTTLAALIDTEGLKINKGTVSTLDFVQALGY